MSSTISEILADLGAGRATLAEVIADFAGRDFTRPPAPDYTYEELVERELTDEIEPFEPDTWDDVQTAYIRHVIDDRQFAALFHAVHGERAKTTPGRADPAAPPRADPAWGSG